MHPEKDRLVIDGARCWGGVFDALDGTVIARRSFRQAQAAHFSHRRLFHPGIVEGIEDGRYHFFFFDALTRRIELAWVNNHARPSSDAVAALRARISFASAA
jgi:hypothetical protein